MGRFDSRGGGRPRTGFGQGSGGFGGSSRGRSDFGPREKHKAVCDDCKQECEVPFKPTEGRPVYCKDCYAKKNPNPRFK